jgi:heme-degrading monooxygenase HmoA
MILEMAVLNVKPGTAAAFENALRNARRLIEASDGFQKMEVRPCLETQNRYLLLVWWESVDDHNIGFRQSDRYEEWRIALHQFYDPFPIVEHFAAPL